MIDTRKICISSFGRYKGGFIAKWYSDPKAVHHSWKKVHAMSKTFLEYGKNFYLKDK